MHGKFGLLSLEKVSTIEQRYALFFFFLPVCNVFVFRYHRPRGLLFYDRWIWDL